MTATGNVLQSRRPHLDRRFWKSAGALLLAAVLGASIALLVRPAREAPPTTSGGQQSLILLPGTPTIMSADDLSLLAGRLEHPIYWAGPGSSDTYETTITSDGRFFIRYLPGADSDPADSFLTVGTYPLPDAFDETLGGARRIDSPVIRFEGGGIAYVGEPATSVFVAFPDFEYQIEVFDPSPEDALGYVMDGSLQPVE